MRRINLFISQDQYEALKRLVTSRVSLSEHIRRAIDDYLLRWIAGDDKREQNR
jgi:predicted CopG family antitoxin